MALLAQRGGRRELALFGLAYALYSAARFDTITTQTGLALDSKLTTSFYNPIAAVPSLHAGFAVAVSAALAAAARRRSWRLLAWLWAPIVCLAVVATGNHFVADIAAGVAITVVGYGAGRAAGAAAAASKTHAMRFAHPAFASASRIDAVHAECS